MLTLFSIPCAFTGDRYRLQENALKCWTLLEPRPEIILFCDDDGVGEATTRHGCTYVPQIARSKSEYGNVPLVGDAFRQAEAMATNKLLCYANADIILLQDFMDALAIVAEQFPKFLMIGLRWVVELELLTDFRKGWQTRLKEEAQERGKLGNASAYDYFVFSKGTLDKLEWLDYQVGSPRWDNWLIGWAHILRIPIVDATAAVFCIHQQHKQGWPQAGIRHNQAIWESHGNVLGTNYQATWILDDTGLKQK